MSGSGLSSPASAPGWACSPAPATAGNAGAGCARPAAAAPAEKRIVLGDLTNTAGCRFGAADAGKVLEEARKIKPLDESGKLKPSFADIEVLKGRLLEEQRRRERAEMELSKLKGIHSREQLASCTVLPSDKLEGSCYSSTPQQFADSKKQALRNLNKSGEAKDRTESATEEFSTVSKEENRPREDHSMFPKQNLRDGDGTSLKDIASRMDITMGELESTIDTLNEIITQQKNEVKKLNERLSIEERKVRSLEQERDQLCSEVAILKSMVGIPELGYEDHSVSNTEVLQMVNTPVVNSESKPELKKTAEWLRAVEDRKGASESLQERGSCEWFFRGNQLMISSEMEKHLKEICDYVRPEIPFYLHEMNKSNLKPNGRMQFSAKYTSAHLLSFLNKREGYARLELDGEDCGMIRIILARDGRASLTLDWEGIVETKIKVGDICAFHFKVSNGDLKLAVHMFHVARYLVSLK